MPKEKNEVHTIGHSNHQLSDFLKLIHDNGIEMVVDVRSSPYSKYSPQFNKKPLEKSLKEVNIEYIYLGNKIGGKPRENKFYHENKVLYHLVEKDQKYQDGIELLNALLNGNQLVLMCSEENPLHCHRHKLIGSTILQRGCKVRHIRGDGRVEEADPAVQTTLF